MSESTQRVLLPNETTYQAACAVWRRGGLVAIPTETVYGLAADAENAGAVARIFAAKERPAGHPLIVHVASTAQARELAAEWPAAAAALAEQFWPGPLTLIVPRGPRIPDVVTGGRPGVALRVPAHPVALALLRAFGGPLAAPSANRHEQLSPTRAAHVLESLGERVDLIVDGGPTRAGIESTLVDLTVDPPRILRPGPLGLAVLRAVLPNLEAPPAPVVEAGVVHSAPGLSRRHYAPRIPLWLVSAEELARAAEEPGVAWLVHSIEPGGRGRRLPDEPEAYAEGLYAALHMLETLPGATRILVERPPAADAWTAIADRLFRASANGGSGNFS